MTDSSSALASGARPGIPELFRGFLALGMMGFGGVLPLARRMLVEERGWLTPAEFTELLGLCQFLPGGNIINLSVAVGMRFHGPAGALACLTGLIAAPTAIVVMLGMVYDRFSADPRIQHVFSGLAAAAAGLLVAMAARIAWPLRRDPGAIAIATLCFIAIAMLRLPLLPTMLVMTGLGIALAHWRQAR